MKSPKKIRGTKRESRFRNKLDFAKLEDRKLLAIDLTGGAGLPTDEIAEVYSFVGDHSSSNSESWQLNVGNASIQASHGDVRREEIKFEKGKSYPASVNWVSTNRTDDDGEPDPDYDYRAWLDESASPAWTSGSQVPSGEDFFVSDFQGLFQKRFFGDSEDPTTGKSATIHVPALDLDIDSLDDSDFLAPTDNTDEDNAEGNNRRGKRINVSHGDIDEDGVIDIFDFDGVQGKQFVPITLSLSSNLAQAAIFSINLSFDYDSADPSNTDSDGLLRIWRNDANQPRSESDYFGSTASYTASELGLSPGNSTTLYLEAVNATNRNFLFDSIKVTANVVANYWQGALTDVVHVRTEAPDVTDVEFIAKSELDLSSVPDAANFGDLKLNSNPDGADDASNTARGRLIVPAFEGGHRFFPDADISSSSVGRNIVRVRANVENVDEGDTVLFRAFDVDDPSDDTLIDRNRASGNDNRGRLEGLHAPDDSRPVSTSSSGFHGRLRAVNQDGLGEWSDEKDVVSAKVKLVDGELIAEVDLLTSFAPGDNFRVIAVPSTMSEEIEKADVGSKSKFRIRTSNENKFLTPQLAVWRYVHVEDDTSIGATGFALLQASTDSRVNRLAEAYIEPNYTAIATIDVSDPPESGRLQLNRDNSIIAEHTAIVDAHRQSKQVESDVFWATYVTDKFDSLRPVVQGQPFINGVTQYRGPSAYEFSVVFNDESDQFYGSLSASQQLAAKQRTIMHEIGHQLLQTVRHEGDMGDINRYNNSNEATQRKIKRWDRHLNIMNANAVAVPSSTGPVDYFYFWRKHIDQIRLKKNI